MRLRRLIAISLLTPLGLAQQPTPHKASPEMTSSYTATRERALAPVLNAVNRQDFTGALSLAQLVLKAYPNDVRVLYLAGSAARNSGDYPDALSFYQQSLNNNPSHSAALHLGLIQTYAAMKNWESFNRERALVRTMVLNGDSSLQIVRGYVIDDMYTGKRHIEVLEFPDPAAITRYRFLFVSDFQRSAGFTPSIDVEANPVDKPSYIREFPQKPSDTRYFALVRYPNADTREFLKFYPNGEPPYEDIHADVAAILLQAPSVTASIPRQFRPSYQPGKPHATPY